MSNSYKDSLSYRSGDLFLSKYIREILETPLYGHHEKTPIYITLWSIMHLISGIITELLLRYYFKVNFFQNRILYGIIIHTFWELWQVIIKMNNPYKLTGKNGLIDMIVDTIMFLIGFTFSNFYIINHFK
jgi:hypothetical protein